MLLTLAGLLAFVAVGVGFPLPEHEHAELRLHGRRLGPPHAPLSAVIADATGARIFAAGSKGEILVRQRDGGALTEGWRRLAPVVDADLASIAHGDGPVVDGSSTPRVFAVGARGALVDCRPEGCRALATHTSHALHAVAIAGGQAFAVGDRGTILHVVADGDRWRRRTPDAIKLDQNEDATDGDPLRVEHVDAGVSVALRAVTSRCDDDVRCRTTIFGDDDVVVEGEGVGACDDGRTDSGPRSTCQWTWKTRKAQPGEAEAPRVELPIHLTRTRGFRRRAATWALDVTIVPQLHGMLGSTSMPIRSPQRIIAATALPGGGGIVITDDGELHAVR